MVLAKPRQKAVLWPEIVPLPENRLAFHAVKRLENKLRRSGRVSVPFHPLLICGPSGTGKTLITTALVKRVVASAAVRTVQTVPAHDLTPNPDGSEGDVDFADLERVDLLVIEDVQQLAKSSIQPLSRLIEARGRRRLATVITSNISPALLKKFPQRLVSRMTAGLVTPLDALSVASREKVLAHTAETKKLRLSGEAIRWLAAKPTGGGLRPLIGQLDLIKSLSAGHATAFTVDELKSLLAASDNPPDAASLDRIISRVAATFQVKTKDLLGPSRLGNVLLPRQVTMFLARDVLKLSLPRIGELLGGRDHTTVLNAIRKITTAMSGDRKLAATIQHLQSELV
ncbi:hypothetical protein BH11PLA2_BH11PLA2_08690 [soil metagenome]